MESVSYGGVPGLQQTPYGAKVNHSPSRFSAKCGGDSHTGWHMSLSSLCQSVWHNLREKEYMLALVPEGSLHGSWFCWPLSTVRTNFLVEKACGRGMADMEQRVMETEKVSEGEYCPKDVPTVTYIFLVRLYFLQFSETPKMTPSSRDQIFNVLYLIWTVNRAKQCVFLWDTYDSLAQSQSSIMVSPTLVASRGHFLVPGHPASLDPK